MGKQCRSKKSETLGKGKVTPIQVAFIVDRCLCDNNFSEARAAFRTEASSLIAKSPVNKAPKSLLSLEAMLNEYISLKEQKVMVEQERARLDHEKFRVHNLLEGMEEVMTAYNASARSGAVPVVHASVTRPVFLPPQSDPPSASPTTTGYPLYKSPAVTPVSMLSNAAMEHGNMSTPVTNRPSSRKRTASNASSAEARPVLNKSRDMLPSKEIPINGPSRKPDVVATIQETAGPSCAIGSLPSGALVQGSNVAKSLFNRPMAFPANFSPGPNTPPQGISLHNEKTVSPEYVSPNEQCSKSSTSQEITPATNCSIITRERVTVSPCKRMAYYSVERNRCVSSSLPAKTLLKRLSKRDNVKGRLDFDNSDAVVTVDKTTVDEISTSESDRDILGIDLPNLDALGENFSFSELLVDMDLDSEGLSFPGQKDLVASTETISGSSPESRDGNIGHDQVMSEFSSTATELISGKDMHIQGPDAVTAVKSVSKCIRIVSPAKNRRNSLELQNSLEID